MPDPYVAPEHAKTAFHCPHCHAYSDQLWRDACGFAGHHSLITGIRFSTCLHCSRTCIWLDEVLVLPRVSLAPAHHEAMPAEVARFYDEASETSAASPRAAAALLRLAIDVLVRSVGGDGTLNEAIGQLVAVGLPERVQQALDVVRVTGNDAVHPGVMDTADDPTVVAALFDLTNMICDLMIAQPARIKQLYDALPSNVLSGIERRDA